MRNKNYSKRDQVGDEEARGRRSVSGRAGATEISESERSYQAQLSALMASPLMFAIEHGDLETVRALIDSGTVGLSARDEHGNGLLRVAAKQKDPEVIRFLIEHGASLKEKNKYDSTPLHMACTKGHTEIAKLFIDLGLDVCLEDKYGSTPLHDACANRFLKTAALLLEYGAKVDARDKNGNTPLHSACSCLWTEVVCFLLEHGADPNVKDDVGCYPLDAVLSFPLPLPAREEIIDLFRQYAPEQVMERFCQTEMNKEISP